MGDYEEIGRGIVEVFYVLVFIAVFAVIFVPLGIWKAIELICWLFS